MMILVINYWGDNGFNCVYYNDVEYRLLIVLFIFLFILRGVIMFLYKFSIMLKYWYWCNLFVNKKGM